MKKIKAKFKEYSEEIMHVSFVMLTIFVLIQVYYVVEDGKNLIDSFYDEKDIRCESTTLNKRQGWRIEPSGTKLYFIRDKSRIDADTCIEI